MFGEVGPQRGVGEEDNAGEEKRKVEQVSETNENPILLPPSAPDASAAINRGAPARP